MTSRTLLTFIGRGQQNKDSEVKRYASTRYQLVDGSISDHVTYFGEALINNMNPDRVIVCGTTGSMWDELAPESYDEDEMLVLLEAVDSQSVSTEMLQSLESAINRENSYSVSLVIVPSGASDEEQITFFKAITSQVSHSEKLTIDITHGFRFMPLFAFSCMQFLQFVRHVEVEELVYAMLSSDVSQVYSLKQILEIGGWVNALSKYDHSGDIGVFAQHLSEQGWPQSKVNQLEKGAFMERVTNSSGARQQLSPLLHTQWDTPLSELLADEFQSRLSWVRNNSRGERECQLAWQYLDRNDFLRAVIYGLEGRISLYLFEHQINDEYVEREEAKQALKQHYGNAFHQLLKLRNSLAHGNKATQYGKKDIINQATSEPESLYTLIKTLFNNTHVSKGKQA